MADEGLRPIIVKRIKKGGGGHHGGAWKIAYADFVTAMMAFFLLMWLLNATSEEQRRGLADYFTPTNVFSSGSSGNGRIFGGRTPFERGEMVSDRGAQSVVPGRAEQSNDQDDPEFDQAPNSSTRGAAEDQRKPEGKDADPGGGRGTRASQQAGRQAGGVCACQIRNRAGHHNLAPASCRGAQSSTLLLPPRNQAVHPLI